MEPKPDYCTPEDNWEGSIFETAAQNAYRHYVDSVGGLTWDGKPIPEWHAIQARQRNGWRAATRGAIKSWLKDAHESIF